MEDTNPIEDKRSNLSRRDLLKALAASSGALTLGAFLPEKWVKPVIQAGVVPVHAQGTCPYDVQIAEALYQGNNQWLVWVNWTPSSPAHPVGMNVYFGGVVASTSNVVWLGAPGPYTGVTFNMVRNIAASGWVLTVRFDWYGDRTCIVSDTTTLNPPPPG